MQISWNQWKNSEIIMKTPFNETFIFKFVDLEYVLLDEAKGICGIGFIDKLKQRIQLRGKYRMVRVENEFKGTFEALEYNEVDFKNLDENYGYIHKRQPY